MLLEPISVFNSLKSINHVSRCPTGYPALNQDIVREDNTKTAAVQMDLGSNFKEVVISITLLIPRDSLSASPSSGPILYLLTF